jgi:hypothetical protein
LLPLLIALAVRYVYLIYFIGKKEWHPCPALPSKRESLIAFVRNFYKTQHFGFKQEILKVTANGKYSAQSSTATDPVQRLWREGINGARLKI